MPYPYSIPAFERAFQKPFKCKLKQYIWTERIFIALTIGTLECKCENDILIIYISNQIGFCWIKNIGKVLIGQAKRIIKAFYKRDFIRIKSLTSMTALISAKIIHRRMDKGIYRTDDQ